MAEYIEREVLKEVYRRYLNAPHVQCGNNMVGQGMQIAIKSCIELLDNVRAADVVEVVRCKDCERMVEKYGMYVCNHALPTKSLTQYIEMGTDILAIVQPDDFCSYGERRADNER